VAVVQKHKLNKDHDPKIFNSLGRAVGFHQSPFDLKLTIKGSWATFFVGVSVDGCAADLGQISWNIG